MRRIMPTPLNCTGWRKTARHLGSGAADSEMDIHQLLTAAMDPEFTRQSGLAENRTGSPLAAAARYIVAVAAKYTDFIAFCRRQDGLSAKVGDQWLASGRCVPDQRQSPGGLDIKLPPLTIYPTPHATGDLADTS